GLNGERTIWIHRGLTQAERRCTLTHELLHREMPDADEDTIERETARRLITLRSWWTPSVGFVTRHCLSSLSICGWTSRRRGRGCNTCDPIEVAEIEAATEGDWSWSDVA
ncbi:hypothetical protein, partial [Gordonia westfalica]